MLKELTIVGGIVRAMTEASSLDDVHSWLASTVRGPRGLIVVAENRRNPPRPAHPLELYEFEPSPYCRKVREAMTELDLAYVSRTCARGASSTRHRAVDLGGKQQFPFLVDPNTDQRLYDSEQIVTYLAETYGPGRSRLGRITATANTAVAAAATLLRPRGREVRPDLQTRQQPDELPVLYNIEASPYCRKVRETLCELNLDYRIENVGKFSARRPELVDRGGKMMVPYLIDPNTGDEMYESDDIIAYLENNYGPTRPPRPRGAGEDGRVS